MRYLALDVGSRRVGLAVCDAGETIVSPLCCLQRRPGRDDVLDNTFMEALRRIVHDQQIEALVVGLPLNMNGSEGPQARTSRRVAETLAAELHLPVHLQDERLSSAAADELLDRAELSRKQRRGKRDMLAACRILQDFLDRPDRS